MKITTVPAKAAFLAEILKEGEEYAGIILGKNGDPDYHLVLLPGERESINWEDSKKWAETIGGDLPTRREQSLLYANLKEHFQPNWYWSGEQYGSGSGSAWFQDFDDGYQGWSFKDSELRARAVRRVIIQ